MTSPYLPRIDSDKIEKASKLIAERTVTVQRGDNLWKIVKRSFPNLQSDADITKAVLLIINYNFASFLNMNKPFNITPDHIEPGQKLILPTENEVLSTNLSDLMGKKGGKILPSDYSKIIQSSNSIPDRIKTFIAHTLIQWE